METLESIEASVEDASAPVAVYVSNNQSTDSTEQCIQDFCQKTDPKRVHLILTTQPTNLGCYGNMRYLTSHCESEWAYILCADDTLNRGSIAHIYTEISKHSASCQLIAFRDHHNSRTRDVIERANGSKFVTGSRGLALFLLYGSLVGTMSNACFRLPDDGSPSLKFDPNFQMSGDFNAYVDLVLSGGTIYLSSVQTVYYRPGSALSAAGGRDCQQFPEQRIVFNKCIQAITRSRLKHVLLKIFEHTVLYYQFYRQAIKRLSHGDSTAMRNLAKCHSGGIVATSLWCLLSFVLIPRPFREIIRTSYRMWLLR